MGFINPNTLQLLGLAKRSAIGANRDKLSVGDLVCALAAAPSIARLAVAETLGRAYEGLAWPGDVEELLRLSQRVDAKVAETHKIPFDEDVLEIVGQVHLQDPTLPPKLFIETLLKYPHHLLNELGRKNSSDDRHPDSVVIQRLEEAARGAAKLREALASRVLGQESAVEMLASAYFRARMAPPAGGPRGIFTFLGPPGVGKTLLAEAFAARLTEAEGIPYAFKRFDMGSYAGHQNFEQLFGAERFYSGAKAGTLTGFVDAHPVAVLLFDEIEKAHENTIQALLAMLDKGIVADKHLDKPVNFGKTWIVFTTNLGREFFNSENEAGVLRGAGLSSAAVFDLLASAKLRRDVGEHEAVPALPLEFVSRLSKGGAVLFNRLETRHHLKIAGLHFSLSGDVAAVAGEAPEMTADDDARFIFLLSLLPDLDARRVGASSEAWAAETLGRAWEECRNDIRSSQPERLPVVVTASDDAKAWIAAEFVENGALKVLVVDDDPQLAEAVAKGCADLAVVVERIAGTDDVPGALGKTRADLLLLDLSIGEDAASPRIERALGVLESVRSMMPDLPVYLFSENPQNRKSFEQIVTRVLRAGGARGYIPCRRDHGNPVFEGDFVAQVRAVLEETRRAIVLRRKTRARQRVSFRTRYRWDAPSATLVAELHGLTDEIVIGAADRGAAIRFAGIPKERFADVAGLDRAKRRLAKVAKWLEHPTTLAAFGVTPPKGFLLAGPPGTGKTLLAKAFAGEAGLPFLAFSAGELQAKWFGESEERVREVFERARRYAPAIIFIDEIDAIAVRRSEGGVDAKHSLLNQLLACMDGFRPTDLPVFVLAATNRADAIDPALKRPGRFDEIIPIDLPNARARTDFFDRRLRGIKLAGSVDVAGLVRTTVGCSPAELDRVVREGVYLAASEGRNAVTSADLFAASRFARFGATLEGETARPNDLRVTAWHEAGHAVVQLTLFPESHIEWVTVAPTESGALGFTAMEADEDKKSLTAHDVRCRLAMLMAGREGERLLVGSDDAVSNGASSDLRRATSLAHAAIARWGFDEEFGLVVVDALDEAERSAVATKLETRLREWLQDARRLACSVLEAHSDVLRAVAEKLLNDESLTGEDLDLIVRGKPPTVLSPGAPETK